MPPFEIGQAATQFHDGVPCVVFSDADAVFDHAVDFHVANAVLHPYPPSGFGPVLSLLPPGQFATLWFFQRPTDHHTPLFMALKTAVLMHHNPRWQFPAFFLYNRFIMGAARAGAAQVQDAFALVTNEVVLYFMPFVLPL